MDIVIVVSPLSLTVEANYFMEGFNEEALSEAAYALHCWSQYADIYNMATKAQKLRALLDYLNSRHSNKQFTMQRERERERER
jgi:hypothetical protein